MQLDTKVLDGLLEPFSRCLDAESALRISEFTVDQKLQNRMNGFAEQANEGLLSDEERSEYESLINAADIIAILKLKAGRHLKAQLA